MRQANYFQLLTVCCNAAPIHYLPLLHILSRFGFPISRFGFLSQHAMCGLIPANHHGKHFSLKMMKQNAVNQSGAKTSRGVSQQFEFINLLNRPGLTDVGTKKAVRAHAMRDFRRRRGESYDNGRRKETPNIKTADPSKPSPTAQTGGRNGITLDPPVWALPKDATQESLPLFDTAYGEGDFHFLMPHGNNDDIFGSPFSFNSDTTFHGRILGDGGDDLGTMTSPERPSKRKKLYDYTSSSVTVNGDGDSDDGDDGDDYDCPSKSRRYHAANEMTVVSPRLIKTPGVGSPDPFNSLPVASNGRMRILMLHCKLVQPLKMNSFFALASSRLSVTFVCSPEIFFIYETHVSCNRFFRLCSTRKRECSSGNMDPRSFQRFRALSGDTSPFRGALCLVP